LGSKAHQARVRIIEAIDALFHAQGFDNTSFADIADAVHISRGNFIIISRPKMTFSRR
jgi:AcrR family transcriptional regulator